MNGPAFHYDPNSSIFSHHFFPLFQALQALIFPWRLSCQSYCHFCGLTLDRTSQQNMIYSPKKKQKKVLFSRNQQVFTSNILELLEELFLREKIDFVKEGWSREAIESNLSGDISLRSNKSLFQEGSHFLSELHKTLSKELSDSLPLITEDLFGEKSKEENERQEAAKKESVRVLVLFYNLLGVVQLSEENESRVLRVIFDLLSLGPLASPQFSSIITALKSRLLAVGFLILKKIQLHFQSEETSQDEEEFKRLFALLVRQKEKDIGKLQFQICRVCEGYFPLNSIGVHLIDCERVHQLKSLEGRLEERGFQLLIKINRCLDTTEKTRLQETFDRMFDTFDGRNALFKLKHHPQECQDLLRDHELELVPQLGSLFSLLRDYNHLNSSQFNAQTLSDQQSRPPTKKQILSIRGICHSSSSLEPEYASNSQQPSLPLCHSERTINSEKDSLGRTPLSSVRLSDFELLKQLGRGSYSEVFLVRKKNTRDLFAMKVMEIEDLNQERMQAFRKEQKIYRSISGPFNVKLYYSFREDNLYCFVLDFGAGGTLRRLLQEEVYLQEASARVYLANLVLAVESLHSMDIIHRDLKPDNIVIDSQGHLILTDFNLCKLIKEKQLEKPNSFYGTPDYIAPEVLKGQPVTQAMDWFSLGVIAYQMVVGTTPFSDSTVEAVFDNIIGGSIDWPEVGPQPDQISSQCKDFIQGLLNPDPQARLGTKSLDQIKRHPFLRGISWSNIGQNSFFFIPGETDASEEDTELLGVIEGKKKKVSLQFIPSEESIVRYDVLKQATNNKAKSRRSSRFKLEKELEDLRFQPQPNCRKQRSHNNFDLKQGDQIRISCHDFSHTEISQQ